MKTWIILFNNQNFVLLTCMVKINLPFYQFSTDILSILKSGSTSYSSEQAD